MPTNVRQLQLLGRVRSLQASSRPSTTLDHPVRVHVDGCGDTATVHATACGCDDIDTTHSITAPLATLLNTPGLCKGTLLLEVLGRPGDYVLAAEQLDKASSALDELESGPTHQWDRWLDIADNLAYAEKLLGGWPIDELDDEIAGLRDRVAHLDATVVASWRAQRFSAAALAAWGGSVDSPLELHTVLIHGDGYADRASRRAAAQYGIAHAGTNSVVRAPDAVIATLESTPVRCAWGELGSSSVRAHLDPRLGRTAAQLLVELIDSGSISVEDAQTSALCAAA